MSEADNIKNSWKKCINLIERIKDALGTDEDGEALIEVARNAHRAEQELAALKRKIEIGDEGETYIKL